MRVIIYYMELYTLLFLWRIVAFCKKTRKILHFLKKKVVFVLVIQKLFLPLHRF